MALNEQRFVPVTVIVTSMQSRKHYVAVPDDTNTGLKQSILAASNRRRNAKSYISAMLSQDPSNPCLLLLASGSSFLAP